MRSALEKSATQFHAIAEGLGGLAGERFVLIELRGGEFRGELLGQAGAGRAVVGTEEETDFGGFVGGECGDDGIEIGALRGFAGLEDLARARWGIEIEHRGLGEGIRAVGIRMKVCWGRAWSGGLRRWSPPAASRRGRAAWRTHNRSPCRGSPTREPWCRGRCKLSGRRQAAMPNPASAVEAPISFRNERREVSSRLRRPFRRRLAGTRGPATGGIGGVFKLARTAPGDGGFAGGNFGVLPNALAHVRLRKLWKLEKRMERINGGRWRRLSWDSP